VTTHQFVSYGDKSSAKRGFGRAFKDLAAKADHFLTLHDGKWGFFKHEDGGPLPSQSVDAVAVESIGVLNDMAPADIEAPPQSVTHADAVQHDPAVVNAMKRVLKRAQDLGVPGADPANAEAMLDSAAAQGAAAAVDEDDDTPATPDAFGKFAAAQLGSRPAPAPAPAPAASSTRIQKQRDEQNGVKRPSTGTVCDQVWEMAQRLTDDKFTTATLGEVIKACEAKGINKFTARTQYARWRVFNGITGRLPIVK
jgi:hypothetical protein